MIVPLLAAMLSFSVNVKGKIILMKGTTSRIPRYLVLGFHSRYAIPSISTNRRVSTLGRFKAVEAFHRSRVDSWGRVENA